MISRKSVFIIICALFMSCMVFAQQRELLENGMYKVNNAGLFGLQDERGDVIISAEYNDFSFCEGYAVLTKDDGYAYGYITDAGEKYFFKEPYFFHERYPFFSEGFLVVGESVTTGKVRWMFIDESENVLKLGKKRYFGYAEPFVHGFAVVRDFSSIPWAKEEPLKHIDMGGNDRFKMEANEIKHRSAPYWSGKEGDRFECVIITDTGIHLCQEDGEDAVIKETLYRGKTVEKYDDPYSFTDSAGGALLFNERGQAETYTPEGGNPRWLIPLP